MQKGQVLNLIRENSWTVYRVCLLWSQQSNLMESHLIWSLVACIHGQFSIEELQLGERSPLEFCCQWNMVSLVQFSQKLVILKAAQNQEDSTFNRGNVFIFRSNQYCFHRNVSPLFLFSIVSDFQFFEVLHEFWACLWKVILYSDEDYFRQMICKGMLWTFGTFHITVLSNKIFPTTPKEPSNSSKIFSYDLI
jgi:hypothetical protein